MIGVFSAFIFAACLFIPVVSGQWRCDELREAQLKPAVQTVVDSLCHRMVTLEQRLESLEQRMRMLEQ